MTKERWKSVKKTSGRYWVSDRGRVKSFFRGKENENKTARMLKPGKSSTGYLHVVFSINGIRTLKNVHRLVLETFKPRRIKDYECAHLDGSRDNNNLRNLKWVSSKENMRQMDEEHGRRLRGEAHHWSKLKESDLTKIKTERANGTMIKTLAEKYDVSRVTIRNVIAGTTWKKFR